MGHHFINKVKVQGLKLSLIKALKHMVRGKAKQIVYYYEVRETPKRIAEKKYNITPIYSGTELCDNIWLCWLQGESDMPEIVRLCYDSMKLHAGKHKVVLLTLDNYKEYCNLPPKYETMLNEGHLIPALFADMLRINLLAQRGGLWLDATIYVKEDIPEAYFSYPFFSIKYTPNSNGVSKHRWTSYCLGRGSYFDPIFCKMAAFFDDYTSHNTEFIDYFLFDYALNYIYENDEQAKRAIDAVPFNNLLAASLYGRVCSPYSEKLFDELTTDSILFKLRYRANEESFSDLIGDGNTIFAHMCKLIYNGKIPSYISAE